MPLFGGQGQGRHSTLTGPRVCFESPLPGSPTQGCWREFGICCGTTVRWGNRAELSAACRGACTCGLQACKSTDTYHTGFVGGTI
jgi:hypothetical protein